MITLPISFLTTEPRKDYGGSRTQFHRQLSLHSLFVDEAMK